MKALPTTVDATLIFSMIVAFVFLPIIISFFKFKRRNNTENEMNSEEKSKNIKYNVYEKMYLKLLKYPKTIIFSFWLIFVLSTIAFVKLGSVNFLPAIDKNNIYINIKYDKSFSLPENKKNTEKIYKYTKEFFDKNYP
jgi:multidrug efflux pump subunit AcrB